MTSTTLPAVTILTSADPGWDQARQAFNLAVDQQPAAIAQPETAAEVQAAVDYARGHNLRVSGQSTGHNAGPLGPLSDTLLIRTDAMRGVTVDAEAWTFRAEAGAWWQDVAEAAASHGLTALVGSSPNVGVAGYTLAGGLSWLGRTYGLATNQTTAFDVVTADGALRHVDARHDPDLFWALRGGGGSFGIVTAIEQRLFPITSVAAGLLWWPIEAAGPVLRAWAELTHADLPDSLTTTARLMRMQDIPELPERIRGGSFVIIDTVFLGSEAEARRLLAPLLQLRPVVDTITVVPARTLGRLHMDPEQPVQFAGDAMTLDTLPPTAIDHLIQLAGADADTSLWVVELRHLGGEIRRARPTNGALGRIDAEYLLFAGSGVSGPESIAHVMADFHELQAVMAPWAAHQMYLNFAETSDDPAHFWSPNSYARLRQIKAEVDPENRIRANHPVPPAEVR